VQNFVTNSEDFRSKLMHFYLRKFLTTHFKRIVYAIMEYLWQPWGDINSTELRY